MWKPARRDMIKMQKIKKRVATPVFTLLLAGLLGLGNGAVKSNPNLPEPPQAPPIFNVRNSPLCPGHDDYP